MFIFQNHQYLYFLSYSHAFHRPAFNQLFFKDGTPKLFCFSGFDFCALTQNDRGTVHFPSDHDPFGIRTLAFFPPRLSHICLRLYPTDLLRQNVDICRSHTNESTVSSQKQKSIILKAHRNEILQSSRLCIVRKNSAVNEWLHLVIDGGSCVIQWSVFWVLEMVQKWSAGLHTSGEKREFFNSSATITGSK